MKRSSLVFGMLLLASPLVSLAQVNSGSDGAPNPTANLVIDMAGRPDGIYHYTSVNIPAGVTVSFIPNAANTPVVRLVEEDCVIAGIVSLNGGNGSAIAGIGGPGGFRGGSIGGPDALKTGSAAASAPQLAKTGFARDFC